MKKYYSPTKPYTRVKRPGALFRLFLLLSKPFIRPRVIRETPEPAVPVIYMANHANDFGPTAMRLAANRGLKTWSAAVMLSLKTAPAQIMKTTFPNARGALFPVCRLLSYMMAPVLGGIFKAAGVIPVYRDLRIKTTYSKTFETLDEGLDVLIFPDSIIPNPDNPFIDVMQKGAFKILSMCLKHKGCVPPVYPVYCCKALKTVVIGKPVSFDVSIPPDQSEKKTELEVGEEIKRLALTLPPHKTVGYSVLPKDIERIRKYMLPQEEKIYEALAKTPEYLALNGKKSRARNFKG